jgi:hypothetical protein
VSPTIAPEPSVEQVAGAGQSMVGRIAIVGFGGEAVVLKPP